MQDELRFYSAAQVRELDRRAIATGISGYTLMQRAAAVAFRELRRRWPEARRVAVVCGSGNNGGDGYEIARLARNAGLEVTICAIGEPPRQPEATTARAAWIKDGGSISAEPAALTADVVVDALLGIGLTRAPEGAHLQAIEAINRARQNGAGVLAVDIPSGLDADRGQAPGAVVTADVTVSFIARKLGLYTAAGADLAGEWVFDGLSVPDECYAGVDCLAEGLDRSALRQLLPRRAHSAHKGRMGHVLIIGGDAGMAGAALLAGRAALRAGAGLVSLATRAAHAAALTAAQPELMSQGVENPRELGPLLERADVVAIGPGLGQSDWGRFLWAQALTAKKPLVVDADGLNWLAQNPARREDWVLTPHPGEAARLLETTPAVVQADRVAAAAKLREEYGGVLVLKGNGSLVRGARLALCPYGNPGMAVGGMGDVLCGLIAGLMAQGLAAEAAARAGVLAHALAGDRAAAHGQRGLLPSDLIAELRHELNP